MRIASLEITGFRNLRQLSLQCASGLNLFIGPNASGKTSLLEALYFLGRGRSFRTRQPRELIQKTAESFRIVAMMVDRDERRTPVGIERSPHELIARIGGEPTRSLAELARQAPVLLLNPDSHRLLEDGPQLRRRFMDWGLFHAEPTFLDTWRRYSVALRHRNAALRTHAPDRVVDAWDNELAIAAITLDRSREAFCKALERALAPFLALTLPGVAGRVDYRRGWPLEPSTRGFAEWLHTGRVQDHQQGHTRLGPHRADFSIRVNEITATEALSRGQQKLLVIALVLAQAELYQRQVNDSCMLLIDDLPAELDPENRVRVMQSLAMLDSQLFVTAIESGSLEVAARREIRTFHLAHGNLAEMV